MSPASRVLAFVLLVLPLLVLTVDSGEAVPTKGECDANFNSCFDKCSDKDNCGAYGKDNAKYLDCFKDCTDVCTLKHDDCLRDASKKTPKPGGAETPHTKVQPKVKPGGAETPDTGPTLHTQPKGGVQQY